MSLKSKIVQYFKEGFFKGIGWSFGVTIGFAIISTLIVVVLNRLGGLPVIGSFIAEIVKATQESLSFRSA